VGRAGDWGQRIRRIPGHVRPRRFRLFGLGEAKTGTTSLADKFGRYRSGHEWDRGRMTPVSNARLAGRLSAADARKELRHRSWRFNLEVDCAYFLAPFAGDLVAAHDDARFVLLVRDCFSWLDSRVEYALRPAQTAAGIESMAARYGRYDEPRRPEEAGLHDSGLFPLTAYLRYWAELSAAVVRDVPADRLCILRTEDLDDADARLAAFVGVDPSTILPAHSNHNERRTGVLRAVADEWIVELATEHCAPLMRQLWGDDWVSLRSRLRYR